MGKHHARSRTLTLAVSVVAALSLAGCMSAGTKFDVKQVDTLVVGKTTYQQAIQTFGDPASEQRSANGERLVTYSYTNYTMRPETFLPIVGGFIGGGDSKSQTLILTFDKREVLKDYQVGSGNLGVGNNLSAQ